ncbi:MAG TPA: ComEC/Rec2 family competence protein [Pyrinomonadaceae bacterium]|jgi:competence protein ComEC
MSNSHDSKPRNLSIYPLLWLAVSFAFGILTANFFNFDWKISLFICLLNALLTIVCLKQKFVCVFVFASFVFLGAFAFQIENQNIPANRLRRIYDEKVIESGEPVEIEGVLQGRPELSVGGLFFKLEAQRIIYNGSEQDVSGVVRLFAPVENEQSAGEYANLDLQYGSKVRVACNLRREESYLNPGVVSRKKILDDQAVDATAVIKNSLQIKKISDERRFTPLAWIYEQRQNLIIEFKNTFSVSTAGILIASLLGNKNFLDKPTAKTFREGGTFHVLVISGLHITFIGALTLLLLRLFTNKRLWQFLLASAFLWSYALAVGAEVPVVRACAMFTILLFSQVIYRHGTLLNSLGACALILLVWRPNDLFSPSFQLTFASVAAIVAAAFPLIENLRKIGDWTPNSETPFPPLVPVWLKGFCESLYWSESSWEFQSKQQIWSARLFKSPYLKWLEAKNLHGVFQYLFEGVTVSLIVQIWLLPFLIIYFHRVSIVSILLNLWVGFFIALESFAAVFAVALAQISDFLAFPFVKLTEVLNALLLSIPKVFVENDWASFRVPVYSGQMKAVYFLYFTPVLILTIALNIWEPFSLKPKFKFKNSKFILFFAAFLSVLFISIISFHPFSAAKTNGKLHIDFLDVGQGDSALITFPNGETLLIDGGGKINFGAMRIENEQENKEEETFVPDAPTVGETVVSEFLWEKGLSQIDYILATHADADHIQGLTDVAKNFRVRAALFGKTPNDDPGFAELYEVLENREIEIVKLKRGDFINFDQVRIEILFPEADESEQTISDNNQSLVLRLIFGNKKFLFTGDIERKAEYELVKNPVFLKADVVKVAHHGSKTSSTQDFINAVEAEYAVISVGRRSPYGHPHKEVVERWTNSGAKIYKTGDRGTISVSTDGKNLEIQTFVK